MKFTQHKKIVLASGSPRRKEYLKRYGLNFKIIIPQIPESPLEKESPLDFVERIAKEKAQKVIEQCSQEEIIIAADTIVTLQNKIIGKPESKADALIMLEELNGQSHHVITSYVIYDCGNKNMTTKTTSTRVIFHNASSDTLKAYASCDEPLDKAGAYSIQDLGTFLIKSIDGSYNNVVGLPVEILLQDLLKIGCIGVDASNSALNA